MQQNDETATCFIGKVLKTLMNGLVSFDDPFTYRKNFADAATFSGCYMINVLESSMVMKFNTLIKYRMIKLQDETCISTHFVTSMDVLVKLIMRTNDFSYLISISYIMEHLP